MVKYLVKTILTASPNNKNFAGEVQSYLTGKGGTIIQCDIPNWRHIDINNYYIEQYGYNTEALAKRSYNYRCPQNDDKWSSEVSIIKYEI